MTWGSCHRCILDQGSLAPRKHLGTCICSNWFHIYQTIVLNKNPWRPETKTRLMFLSKSPEHSICIFNKLCFHPCWLTFDFQPAWSQKPYWLLLWDSLLGPWTWPACITMSSVLCLCLLSVSQKVLLRSSIKRATPFEYLQSILSIIWTLHVNCSF